MKAFTRQSCLVLSLSVLICGPCAAEILSSAPDHYTLYHESLTELSPDEAWARLIEPASWWSPEHTYSGDAANLSLDLQAGGLWREDWQGGSVAHGGVLSVQRGTALRLDAPFGPLQGMAVNVVWTISISQTESGTLIIFDEVATGSRESGLDAIAPAIDLVKQEAIERLAAVPQPR